MLLSDVLAAAVSWQPADGDTILLAADETDLPVIETLVATLPARARGRVFVEVESESRIGHLETPGRVCVSWLVRERGQSLRTAVDAYLAEMLPLELEQEHRVYAWIAGERSAHAITSA
ncbi:SIP domain-containing protein [Schumannella sp. 10F1B-5-1]|uniref:SIP domain-containing protein n=1 Tax=Schumannella sp. 10F1B-5-1 TaxID=2590780 RepID=UPI001131D768|nr:SIP domain-containing protein [Schumannella sp. 10F1B-5-1]TPW70655.1 siderophore-interacting protein [Schumannella sp. 10F1B-5-1]